MKNKIFKHPKGAIVGDDLVRLVTEGAMLNLDLTQINPCSVDVRLSDEMMCEVPYRQGVLPSVHVTTQSQEHLIPMVPIDPNAVVKAWELPPKTFCLAKTKEMFNLPANVTGTFTLRSVCARNGLEQCMSIKMWAGFQGILVLELYNFLMRHKLVLREGDLIGQVEFTCHSATSLYSGKYVNQK